jgi:hypothetical protein
MRAIAWQSRSPMAVSIMRRLPKLRSAARMPSPGGDYGYRLCDVFCQNLWATIMEIG